MIEIALFEFGLLLIKQVQPILSNNHFSSTKYNYSNADKLIAETFLSYWISFTRYDDPNHLSSNKGQAYWQTFMDKKVNIESLSSQQKNSMARYLVFDQCNNHMTSDFSSHNCVTFSDTLFRVQ